MNTLPVVYQHPPLPTPGYLRTLDAYGRPIHVSILIGAFEAAGKGRRLGTWGLSSAGPSTVVSGSLSSIRSRSRQLIRNHPLVDGGVDSYVANLIGSGINPRWQVKDPAIKEALQQLWDDWIEEADFSGTLNFYGLQSLICRGMIDAGEILCRLVPRDREKGLSVPLQLQLLEGDHLDEAYNTTYHPWLCRKSRLHFSRSIGDYQSRRVDCHDRLLQILMNPYETVINFCPLSGPPFLNEIFLLSMMTT